MKIVQLILRKIIKIVATRCQILRLKCTIIIIIIIIKTIYNAHIVNG